MVRIQRWTAGELDRLATLVNEHKTTKEIHREAFPHRTFTAVQNKRFSLVRTPKRKWRDRDERQLRQCHAAGLRAPEIQAKIFPTRTLREVEDHLRVLVGPKRPWTQEEVDALAAHLAKGRKVSYAARVSFQDRSAEAVRAKAREIKGSQREQYQPWTPAEDARLRFATQTMPMSAKAIRDAFFRKRTTGSVRARLYELGKR